MRISAKFRKTGRFRPCISDLPDDIFYRSRNRPELTIATHRNSIKAWGGRGILDLTHINGVDVKFIHRGTYETFSRYEATYDPANLQSIMTPQDLVAETTPVDKPKKKRTSFVDKIRRREEWLSKQNIPRPADPPENDSDIVDLDISWFDNRFGTYDGVLFHEMGMARVLVAYQQLWGRPKVNWRSLNIQRHPEPIPVGENWKTRGYMPGFLARLVGKYVAIKGVYVGQFGTNLVPGWPMKGNTKYGMKKLTCVMANEEKIRGMINEEVRHMEHERLGRLRQLANDYDYDGYKKELEVQA